MFIEPLFAEDANIKNELVLPRGEFLPTPDGSVRSFGAAFEKALWPDRWSVIVEASHVSRHAPAETVSGFEDLEFGTKVAVYRSTRHELVVTPALFVTVPTGSRKVAGHRTEFNPAFLFAKGLGDLKIGWLRPLALQGGLGFEAAASGEPERHLNYDLVLEYSIPYLNQFIRRANAGFNLEHNLRLGHSLRAILGDLFPFLEFNASTPVAGTEGITASFLRPGALYMGKYFQVTAAADVPLRGNSASHGVGAVILIDVFLDQITPVFKWTPFGKHRHPNEHED